MFHKREKAPGRGGLLLLKTTDGFKRASASKKFRKPKKKTTIRRRLLTGILGLTVAISVCTSVALCGMFYNNTKTSVEQQVLRVALAYNTGVQNAIQNYKLKIKSMASSSGITDPQAKDQWEKNLGLFAAGKDFSAAGLADANGKTLDGQDFSQYGFFKDAMQGSTALSTVEKQKDGSLVLYAAARVSNGTDYDGVVYGVIPAALIQASSNAVQDGAKIADETGEYLKEIITDVDRMSGLLQSIAAAAGEQASAVRRVNTNVEQISAVVQTNSATAEESAATSEELSRLAGELSDMLGRFRLAEQAGDNVIPIMV